MRKPKTPVAVGAYCNIFDKCKFSPWPRGLSALISTHFSQVGHKPWAGKGKCVSLDRR
jgi:hypothetical protein